MTRRKRKRIMLIQKLAGLILIIAAIFFLVLTTIGHEDGSAGIFMLAFGLLVFFTKEVVFYV